MDVHNIGINIVLWLQTNLGFMQSYFLWFSKLGDPRNVFLFIFPLCYGLSRKTGINCIWIAALTEWTNAILKWFFQDDRPYWYIKNTPSSPKVFLKQFSITCETGPGFPSGHVMSITAVGLHVLLAVNSSISEKSSWNKGIKALLKHGLTAVFLTIVSMVAISRVYIATHFPHQVVVAFFLGICIVYAVKKLNNNHDASGFRFCVVSSVTLLLFAFVFHEILALWFDPSSTVALAQQWCLVKEWVHLDTTPFYAVTRDSGGLFGLGLGRKLFHRFKTAEKTSPSFLFVIIEIILDVLMCSCLEGLVIPQGNSVLFYSLAFCKFSLVSIIVVFVTPILMAHINPLKSWTD